LPGFTPVLSLRLKGNVHYPQGALPRYALSGLRNSPRLIQYDAGTANLLIIFREGGMQAFFNTPAHECFNESIPLQDLIDVTFLEDQLTTDFDNSIAVVQNFLLQQLKHAQTDPLVSAALQHIKQQRGQLSITALATSLYISQDAFEKRFRKVVGTTPKQFASLVRMKAIVQNPAYAGDFTQLALDAGYFDQSHFNKAFRQFTGLTPSSFFKAPPQW
jgi:AraC-like DNA-binding protein